MGNSDGDIARKMKYISKTEPNNVAILAGRRLIRHPDWSRKKAIRVAKNDLRRRNAEKRIKRFGKRVRKLIRKSKK